MITLDGVMQAPGGPEEDPVVHFEMPAKDKNRVSDFYSKVFGWKMVQLGKEMGNYVLASTTETDKDGMVQRKGAINGGFFDYQDKEGFNIPHLVISVDNLEESMEKVQQAGGKVIGGSRGKEPDDIPGIGLYVSFIDSEGNHVGMLQPTSR